VMIDIKTSKRRNNKERIYMFDSILRGFFNFAIILK